MDNGKTEVNEKTILMTVENSFTEYPNIVTVPQLMEMLNIGRSSAYRMLEKGELQFVKIGSCYKIPKVSVINYINKTMTIY